MAQIFPISYGAENYSDLFSGVPLATPGLRLVDHADIVGPERTNRPLKNLHANDVSINNHIKEVTRLLNDGVFPDFGEAFKVILTSPVDNNTMTFEVRSGLGKIGEQAFEIIYQPNSTIDYDVDEEQNTFPVTIPPDVTTFTISIASLTTNQFRRDLVTLDDTGEIVIITGTPSSFQPAEYSQIDAPAGSIALYSILFRKVSGIAQTPVINAVYDTVEIEGVDLIENFAELFGNGIFIGEPETETDPLKKEFTPSVIGGNEYGVSAGTALIDGALVKYGAGGNSIILNRATYNIGTGDEPGPTQGQNPNAWELVDFTTNTQGAAGVGNGNTQFLLFDNTGGTGLIDPASIRIVTAAPVGEGGYGTLRPFDTNIIAAPGAEEYSIDLTNGTIIRDKASAPLRVFIKYSFYRNRRYLPYINKFGVIAALQSADTYPANPPEFVASQLPADTIGLKSILYSAVDQTLQGGSLGADFRVYQNFQLINGQVPNAAIQDGAVTGDKLASGAIDNSDLIGDEVIIERHLSAGLLNSLSSSRVYARNSLAFKVQNSDVNWSFADNTNAIGTSLTKNLTDINGNNLIYTDAELQTTTGRRVVIKPIFKEFISTEITTNPENATSNFVVTDADIANIKANGENFEISGVELSFQDFGFSQVGNVLLQIYNITTNSVVADVQVPLSTVKAAVETAADAFYALNFASPVTLSLGATYRIRVSKTIPTDTLFLHTAIEGPSRNTEVSYRILYKAPSGKYGQIGGQIQGYRIFDDFGDITVATNERAQQSRPSFYIPYAANIADLTTFTVFQDTTPTGTAGQYVAVDVVRGLFKFANGFDPISARITTDHNIITGLADLSSERIHRPSGLTIEHSLRVLETELGSVRANVRNMLERLYHLGKSPNGSGIKFRFSSEDRQLTNLAGTALELTDGNMAVPIPVIDRQYLVSAGRESSRAIQDAYNATDVIEFVPRFETQIIFALNIDTVGTDYDAIEIQLHEGEFDGSSIGQPPAAFATKAKSGISAGLNFFNLEYNYTIGETYHVLIRVLNFLGGLAIRPRLKVDVENGDIEYQQFFLPVAGKYGSPDGYALFDDFGDLNIGSAARGATVDQSQENFLDADGWQLQNFFDDNDQDPTQANTTFPIFTPTRPDRTGMVRFDIYFRQVPLEGEDGFNGVFRLLLHNSNNEAITPSNALPGNDFLEVRVPKTTGWYEIPFLASLEFGESYHMHLWTNGFDIQAYVGTHPVTDAKAFRFIAGERFIPFAANLCDPDSNFDDFEIVSRKLVAVDVTCGRIKFHPEDIVEGNNYFANFNLFTNTANLQADTIVRVGGNTIEDSFLNTVIVRGARPTRNGIGYYQFNARNVKIVDQLGRVLDRKDGELTNPYERIAIEDNDVSGSPSTLTTTETDNQYSFFVGNFEESIISSIAINYTAIGKDYFNTIARFYEAGGTTPLKTAYIRARDLIPGENRIPLEDVSGNPLNLVVQPNTQYVIRYVADVSGPGTAPQIAKNTNDVLTHTIYTKPVLGGLYGTGDGIKLLDTHGDIFRFNINRDTKSTPQILINTNSGLAHLKIANSSSRGIAVWQESETIRAQRFNIETGDLIDASKIEVAGSSGDPAIQPDVAVADNIAYVTWVQSGQIYSRRLFLNNSNPLSVDTIAYKVSDDASGVAYPSVGAGSDRVVYAWEDTRDTSSGVINPEKNATNIFSWSFNNATSATQFVPNTNKIGNTAVKINTTANEDNVVYQRPKVSIYENRAVYVYQSDINNEGLSKDIFLAVYDYNTSGLVRSDIRVDKAPVVSTTTQLDAKSPRISNYRNKFAIAWLDNRNATSQYQPFCKIYDSKELIFDQDDEIELDSAISGITDLNINASEKTLSVGISNGSNAWVRRFDFASLTAHDTRSFNINFDLTLGNLINSSYPVSFNKITHNFGVSVSGNAIVYSRVNGVNIEPIAEDLTDTTLVTIKPGYVGIDVLNGTYLFAPGEEI